MLSVSDALDVVLKLARPGAAELVHLASLPLRQVLAESVASDIDSPPYTKALMDGYALRAGDCASIPLVLRVIEEIAAGKVPTKGINSGEAARIMTGAPVPDGADSVVMIEKTETVATDEVRILEAVKPNQNILTRGAEMKAGEVVLQPGCVLGPQELGLLAAVGRCSVMMYPRARVAVLATGDEIVEPSQKPGPGQIRNSNGPMLLGQVARAGGVPQYLGIARDDIESLRSLIGRGLEQAEVLILSGGVSAGKFDLVPGVLQEMGVTSHFHKVSLKPGKPLFFGTRGSQLVFGLPGNPVGSYVCFELFIRPALHKLAGHEQPGPYVTAMPIATRFRSQSDRPTYWPARIEQTNDGMRVRALPWFGSADLRALHSANALLVIPPGLHEFVENQKVGVIALDG